MIRIVHISELHFGTERPALARALGFQIHAPEPDLVAARRKLT